MNLFGWLKRRQRFHDDSSDPRSLIPALDDCGDKDWELAREQARVIERQRRIRDLMTDYDIIHTQETEDP